MTTLTNYSQAQTQPVQIATPSSTPIEPPSAWMQYGTSPTEVILATAIVIGAIATVIFAVATLIQVLVPVMLSDQGDSSSTKLPKK